MEVLESIGKANESQVELHEMYTPKPQSQPPQHTSSQQQHSDPPYASPTTTTTTPKGQLLPQLHQNLSPLLPPSSTTHPLRSTIPYLKSSPLHIPISPYSHPLILLISPKPNTTLQKVKHPSPCPTTHQAKSNKERRAIMRAKGQSLRERRRLCF